MRVLLLKTSSMGDVIHTLPALSDAIKAIPQVTFDWVVEEAFAEIPRWHGAVNEVIPIAFRRWRKTIFKKETRLEWHRFRHQLRDHQYDLVLDAQGLMKSAFLTWFAKGHRVGLNWSSARESLASLVYQEKINVNFYQHAIIRMRLLLSAALHYPLSDSPPDFGLTPMQFAHDRCEPYVVFLHGTTWHSKQWPESYWIQLAEKLAASGIKIKMSGGNIEEVERAHRIAKACPSVLVIPYLSITEMARLVTQSKAVVAVDTGFGHLASALAVPTISIYGATNAILTGALGANTYHLSAQFPCSPCLNRICTFKEASLVSPACYATVPPERVFETLKPLINAVA